MVLVNDGNRDTAIRWSGVTIVELVLVILILGVIAIGIGPKFDAYYAVDLRSAVRTLVSDIRYAQSQAIATRIRCGLTFDAATETYMVYLENPSTPADDLLNPGATMTRRFENVDLVSASFDGATYFEFDAMGVPHNASGDELSSIGSVILGEAGDQDTVTVRPITGKVEMHFYTAGGGGGGCSSGP